MRSQSTTTSPALTALLDAATPVLRIDSLKSETWRRRPGKNPSDIRIGPWRAARWSILNDAVYRADGEVLYFLRDGAARIRYVGQTTGRLRTRWRTPPLAEPVDGKSNAHVFHNIAWPHIEEALDSDPAVGPFLVSAIRAKELAALVERYEELRSTVGAEPGNGDSDCLSRRVETWVCNQLSQCPNLWNRVKRRSGSRRQLSTTAVGAGPTGGSTSQGR